MNLDKTQQNFIRDNKRILQSIFEVWTDGLKDKLVEEDDNDKAAILRRFIKEFKVFSSTMSFINKEDKKKDIKSKSYL